MSITHRFGVARNNGSHCPPNETTELTGFPNMKRKLPANPATWETVQDIACALTGGGVARFNLYLTRPKLRNWRAACRQAAGS